MRRLQCLYTILSRSPHSQVHELVSQSPLLVFLGFSDDELVVRCSGLGHSFILCNTVSDGFFKSKGHIDKLFKIDTFFLPLKIQQLKLRNPLKFILHLLHRIYNLE